MDAFDFEKLGKELAVARLKDGAPAAEAAAEVLRSLAVPAVNSTSAKQVPQKTIVDSCKGVMGGVLLAEKELPAAAVALLEQTAAIAGELNLDPAEVMTWAMQGIAAVCAVAGAAAQSSVQDAIEAKFMGAGEVFAAACKGGGA